MTYHHKCKCGAELQFSTDIKLKSEFICFKCKSKYKFQENDYEKLSKGNQQSE